MSFQSGRPTGTVMQLIDIGRCTAASISRSSADAFCANAVAKASSGSQIKPLLSGVSFGAWGAIEDVCDLLALVGSQSGDVDELLHSFGTCESDDCAGVGVSYQYDRRFSPVEAAVKGGHVVGKRR